MVKSNPKAASRRIAETSLRRSKLENSLLFALMKRPAKAPLVVLATSSRPKNNGRRAGLTGR
jgi:hypothetical protein